MRKTVIDESGDGAVVEYETDPEERARRLLEWAEQAAANLQITPGQAERLSRA